MTIAALILSIGMPSFRNLVADSRLTTSTNNLIASISYARSEAIKRAQDVSIVAATGWQSGWIIVDEVGATIRTFEAPDDKIRIAIVPPDMTTLRFDSRGLLSNQAQGATFSVCDTRPNETGRQIQITATGRPQLNRKFGGCG